jgi:hypothetical protein
MIKRINLFAISILIRIKIDTAVIPTATFFKIKNIFAVAATVGDISGYCRVKIMKVIFSS